MLRFRHNSQAYFVRSGRSCRTVRYIPAVANRTWFLFSVSSFKVDNPAAARREATPPHFCLSERQPKHYDLPRFYVEPKFSAFSFGEFKVSNSNLPAPRRLRTVGLTSRCHRSFTVVRSAFGRRQATCGYFTAVPHPAVRHTPKGRASFCGAAPLPYYAINTGCYG